MAKEPKVKLTAEEKAQNKLDKAAAKAAKLLEKELAGEKGTVKTDPEVKLEKEELVSVLIDREMTDGGIRINGKLFVGTVNVSPEQAEDLLRIQSEYFETKKKLLDKNVRVRMKSDFQKEMLFLADPEENEGKKGFTRDYGLLPSVEWGYCTPKFKEHLLTMRKQLYGY